ncbi:hypothetical protein B6A42_07275 [Vibrio coralliilyticus]|nr:hypothetical protein B6A42_07275 [Vibrio coralliilyticus]MBE4008434.1 hypothetical protein [Vibrio parahaemolyticus]MDF4691926.1 hypothetical protein [Vibrio parahaemolyticus]
MLNKSFFEEIKESLNTNYFTPSDFDINKSDSSLLHITFKYADYDFKLVEVEETDEYTEASRMVWAGNITRTSSHTVLYAIYRPGKYKATDKVQISFSALAETIQDWSKYITNDLIVTEDDDALSDQLREDLEQVFTIEDVENEEEVANAQEQQEVEDKLDRLYERLEELNEKVQFASDEMAKIKKEIDTLKSSATRIPKGIWAKIAKNRLVDIAIKFFKTPEGRDLIVHTIKQALPS